MKAYKSLRPFTDHFIYQCSLKREQATAKDHTGTISDKGFRISGSLQFQFPIGPHSQAASLCHIEAPATVKHIISDK